VGFVGGDDGEAGEAEVRHGPGHSADVEGITRRDEDDGDTIALFWS
jgi:hypothetical protein